MNKVAYLSKKEYKNFVENKNDGHWTTETIDIRWDYHSRAIELLKALGINNSKKVLEMGTMGVSCVLGSDTIDYTEHWNFEGKNPTYVHDARITPWPIEDKAYEVFVALRVFQHLVPSQREAVKEAFRIAEKIILVVPEWYDNSVIPDSKGLTYKNFVDILDGVHPNLYFPTSFGSFFFWDTKNPSNLDLEIVMKNIKLLSIRDYKSNEKKNMKSKVTPIMKKILRKLMK